MTAKSQEYFRLARKAAADRFAEADANRLDEIHREDHADPLDKIRRFDGYIDFYRDEARAAIQAEHRAQ